MGEISLGGNATWRRKAYKYMHIYLWTTLRIMDLRMRGLRMQDLRIRVFVQDEFLVFNVGFGG